MAPFTNIRRHTHVDEVITYLRHCGADDISVAPGRRVHITWRVGDTQRTITLPSAASRRADEIARTGKQMVRRKFREAGIEVRA